METVESSNPIITRYAPTPSGLLHLGNIINFIYTWSLAKKFQAKIVLRIDDIDSNRVRDEYLKDIFETLEWLDLDYQIGPSSINDFKQNFSQLKRIDLYREYLKKLESKYYCDCSRSFIKKIYSGNIYRGFCRNKNLTWHEDKTSVRIHVDKSYQYFINNNMMNLSKTIGDFVVWKKNDTPSYQLTSVVDDHYYKVNLICRGDDLESSTCAQLYLDKLLALDNLNNTSFFFHSLLKKKDQQKLSKSKGDLSIQSIRKKDPNAKALYSMISKLIKIENCENKVDFYNILKKRKESKLIF